MSSDIFMPGNGIYREHVFTGNVYLPGTCVAVKVYLPKKRGSRKKGLHCTTNCYIIEPAGENRLTI